MWILLANSGTGRLRHEPGESGLARSRQRGAGEPGAKPHQVHRRGRDHMLQLGLGQPDIARPAQSLRPNPGREGSFNASPPPVLLGKRCLALARLQHELAPLGVGAACLQRTGLAVPGREADLHDRVAPALIQPPAAAPLPSRAGCDLALPIEAEVPQRKAILGSAWACQWWAFGVGPNSVTSWSRRLATSSCAPT